MALVGFSSTRWHHIRNWHPASQSETRAFVKTYFPVLLFNLNLHNLWNRPWTVRSGIFSVPHLSGSCILRWTTVMKSLHCVSVLEAKRIHPCEVRISVSLTASQSEHQLSLLAQESTSSRRLKTLCAVTFTLLVTCLRSAKTLWEFRAGALSPAVNWAERTGSSSLCGNLADTNSLLSEEEDVVFRGEFKNCLKAN